MDWSKFLNDNSNAIGSMFNTGAAMYGQQNAGEAISKAATGGMKTATDTMGTVTDIWNPQRTLGVSADTALGSALGINGQKADYSNFMNMPGYQFAVEQGTRAAERQAAAMGNAGNSGTSAMIGNQVAGTAMQDYNNYINQLYQAAGLGSTANTALTGANMQTAGNIEQLGMNSGIAQAGLYTGMGQSASGVGGRGPGGGGGYGGTGVGGVGGIISGGLKALGGWLGNNGGGNSDTGFMSGGGFGGTDFSPYVTSPDQGGGGFLDPAQGGYGGAIPTDENGNPTWDTGFGDQSGFP